MFFPNCTRNHTITNRSFSLTWSVAPVGWWNNTKYLNKKELIPIPYTNMAAISLFWYTNMAAVTSDENDLYKARRRTGGENLGGGRKFARLFCILPVLSSPLLNFQNYCRRWGGGGGEIKPSNFSERNWHIYCIFNDRLTYSLHMTLFSPSFSPTYVYIYLFSFAN
jgi:hypothetical protein